MADTLTDALRLLARDIDSQDGVANAVILQAADEIDRLREAIRRLAEQDATLSVCEGNVTVEMDGITLTAAERTAIQRLREDYEGDGEPASAGAVATLRGLLDRLEPIATGDNDRSQPVKNDARLAALERLVALDQELEQLSGSAPLSCARQSPDSVQ